MNLKMLRENDYFLIPRTPATPSQYTQLYFFQAVYNFSTSSGPNDGWKKFNYIPCLRLERCFRP